jgi:hypothetical protein
LPEKQVALENVKNQIPADELLNIEKLLVRDEIFERLSKDTDYEIKVRHQILIITYICFM